jgi:hypothetical protein
MKDETTFNVRSAFLVHTALIAAFMVVVSLGSLAHWFSASTLNPAPATFNSSSGLLQK